MLFIRKQSHFIAILLLLSGLAGNANAVPLDTSPRTSGRLTHTVAQRARWVGRIIARHQRPLAYAALASLIGYVGIRLYKRSVSPYLHTVSQVNNLLDRTIGDFAAYLQSEDDELPQSTRQVLTLLSEPEVRAFARALLQSNGPTLAQRLMATYTPERVIAALNANHVLLTRLTEAAVASYFRQERTPDVGTSADASASTSPAASTLIWRYVASTRVALAIGAMKGVIRGRYAAPAAETLDEEPHAQE